MELGQDAYAEARAVVSATRAEPVVPPEDQEASAPPRKTEVVFSLPTVVKALGVFFGVLVIFLVKDALLSIALAIVMILGLDPPVSALERRGWVAGRPRCASSAASCSSSS